MPSKKALAIYITAVVALALCAEGLLCGLLFFDRAGFIQFVVQVTHKPYLQAMLENSIVTPEKFVWLQRVSVSLMVIIASLVFVLYRLRYRVIRALRFIGWCVASAVRSVKKEIARSTNSNQLAFVVLLLIIAVKAMYYVVHFDLQYDEMWSYNYFTSKPFYLSLFTYNNYPLYELSTQLFKWLPFSMKINLRLPCLLAGLGTCLVLYACIKNYTGNALTALAGMAIFACMPITVFYMLYARGVMFELFFAVASVFCLLYMLRGVAVKKYGLLYVLANVAGLYSMPTHLYFVLLQVLVALLYIARYKKRLLKPFALCNIAVFVLALLCYLPVVAGSGFSFLLNAAPYPAYATRNIAGFIAYTKGTGNFFTGYPAGLVILVVLTLLLVAVFNKGLRGYGLLLLGAALLAFLPTLIYMMQGTAITDRAVAFTGLAIPFCFCLAFYAMRKNFTPYTLSLTFATIFVAGNVISHQQDTLHWSEAEDKKAIMVSNLLMQHKVATCYDSATTSRFFYFYPALEYYYGQQHRDINLYMAIDNSLRYTPYKQGDKYDCVIKNVSSIDSSLNKNYSPIYTDAEEGFSILVLKK